MGYADYNLDITEVGTDATVLPQVGTNVVISGQKYCAVYNAGASATAAGDVCCVFKTTPVQGHISTTSATMLDNGTAGLCAGIAVSVIAAASGYGWIQVAGYCSNFTTDGGVAAGNALVVDGGTSVGKVFDTMADGEEECVFAFADAADTSTVGTGYLQGILFNV